MKNITTILLAILLSTALCCACTAPEDTTPEGSGPDLPQTEIPDGPSDGSSDGSSDAPSDGSSDGTSDGTGDGDNSGTGDGSGTDGGSGDGDGTEPGDGSGDDGSGDGEDSDNNDDMETNSISLTVNGVHKLTATLADNSSTAALKALLADGPLTIQMNDYAGMEKVGPLGTTLPRNDEQINTEPGDLILYLGTNFVIYYDTNSWSLTRLGKIDDITAAELRSILGTGSVTVTLSL